MINIEEKINLLNDLVKENKYEEAYKTAFDFYNESKNNIFLLFQIGLDIDYIHKLDPIYCFEKIKNMPAFKNQNREGYRLFRLIQLSDMINDQNQLIIACKKLIDLDRADAYIYFMYSKSLFVMNKNLDEALLSLNEIDEEELPDDLLCDVSLLKIRIYVKENKLDKCEDLLMKLIYKFKNRDYYLVCNALYEIIGNNNIDNVFETIEMVNEHIAKMTILKFIKDAATKTKDNKNIIKALEKIYYLSENIEEIENEIFELACAYIGNNEIKKAFQIYDYYIENNINKARGYYYYARYYENIGNKESMLKTIYYNNLCFEIMPHIDMLFQNANHYLTLHDIKNLEDALTKIMKYNEKNNLKMDLYFHYLLLGYYTLVGDFDQAYIENKACLKHKIIDEYEFHLRNLDIAKNPDKSYKFVLKHLNNKELSSWDYRLKAIGCLHGLYKQKIDLKMAKEYINKALETDKNLNCFNSIYGRILLEENDSLAYKVFLEGTNNYINGNDLCPCCVPYLAYCYIKGIGIEENYIEARKLLTRLIEEENYNTNTILLLSYLASFEGDVENAYKILSSSKQEQRYIYSILQEKKKLAIRLGKKDDLEKINAKIKIASKYASKREIEYYSKDTDFPMLDNF